MRKALFFVLFFLMPMPSFSLSDEGFEKLHNFTKVLHLIEKDYVEDADEKKLIDGAIRGMLSTLDPHSAYLSPDFYRELKVGTEGKFDGVGIEVAMRKNKLTIVSPLRGTPADKIGLRSGDVILSIDGKPTEGIGLIESVQMMRGKRGSKISLLISREGVQKPFAVEVVRQKIVVPSVKGENFDGYGCITISSFQNKTTDDVRRELAKLRKKGEIKGLLLDLRHNPGGLLDEAVKIADIFLDEGIIVTSYSRGREFDRREASKEGTEPFYPMIVLIDGGSASASEIVAGALQDHKRALILGEPSFGKGSLQTVFDLEDGSALKLTVGTYHTPSGRSIQALGIQPDIAVPFDSSFETKKRHIRESDLAGHLGSETKGKKDSTSVLTDHQKEVALTYLRSWDTFSKDLGEGKSRKNNKK